MDGGPSLTLKTKPVAFQVRNTGTGGWMTLLIDGPNGNSWSVWTTSDEERPVHILSLRLVDWQQLEKVITALGTGSMR